MLFKLLFLVLLLFISYSYESQPLSIASFNVRMFGKSKMKKPEVVKILVKILGRYDLVVIQEIRDKSGSAFRSLMKSLNENYMVSPREGRTHSKEQYGVIYDGSKLNITDTWEYPDPKDEFERSPYALMVHPAAKKIPDFIMIVVHLDPDHVVKEMNALHRVAEIIDEKWESDNLIVTGDMNADCGYLSNKKLHKLKFSRDRRYKFLIADGVDTTIGKMSCAYDRFIVRGGEILEAVVLNSAKPFPFDEKYNLTEKVAKHVSDHKPIEMKLKPVTCIPV